MEVIDDDSWRDTTRYQFFAMEPMSRKLEPPIQWKGREIHRYDALHLIVCDKETGELFRVAGIHQSERCHQRLAVLRGMRSEVRLFANFVLDFRNNRRGTTPGIDVLVCWFADLYGLRKDNVRRYVAVLKNHGVLESETLMGRLFQFSSAKADSSDFLAEQFIAERRYQRMLADRERLRARREQPALLKIA